MTDPITRRTLLRTAATTGTVAAGGLAYASLPAWARTFPEKRASAQGAALRKALSLPFPKLPAGKFVKGFAPEIEHVVVLMMENHSFDNLLGMVPHQVKGREHVNGLTMKNGKITNSNPATTADPTAGKVTARHAPSPCQPGAGPDQSWDSSHQAWNHGKNNGFVEASTDVAMWYWDKSDIPFTYSLVEHYPFGQKYFCSTLAQTYPNRRFLFCATASGLTQTDDSTYTTPAANGTIFNLLNKHRISWKDYVEPTQGTLEGTPLIVPEFFDSSECLSRLVNIDEFYKDAREGKLPSFSFVDPNYVTTSEENPQDIQIGEQFIAKVVNAITHSPNWHKTALFITYDEHGGYYDHVAPPAALLPDDIAPIQADASQTLAAGTYNRYGFRVPMIVVSPWAKKNYVSDIVQDHTSITAFIEHKWNLPAMSARDANAHPLIDYFDFKQPSFKVAPKLASAPSLTKGLAECDKAGLPNPPGA